MTPTGWLVVAVAGAAGALVRHEVTARAGAPLRALHACNVLGSAALGLVLGLGLQGPVVVGLAAGGLGSLTSFSTWMVGARQRGGARDVVVPLALAVGAAVLGVLVGELLGGAR